MLYSDPSLYIDLNLVTIKGKLEEGRAALVWLRGETVNNLGNSDNNVFK